MTGGINAVRQSLDAQNRALEADGKEAVDQALVGGSPLASIGSSSIT